MCDSTLHFAWATYAPVRYGNCKILLWAKVPAVQSQLKAIYEFNIWFQADTWHA